MDKQALFSGMRQIKDAGFVDWANAGARMLGGAVTRGVGGLAKSVGATGVARGIGAARTAMGGSGNLNRAVGYGTAAMGLGAVGLGGAVAGRASAA